LDVKDKEKSFRSFFRVFKTGFIDLISSIEYKLEIIYEKMEHDDKLENDLNNLNLYV
jgi:hypothetical protein